MKSLKLWLKYGHNKAWYDAGKQCGKQLFSILDPAEVLDEAVSHRMKPEREMQIFGDGIQAAYDEWSEKNEAA